MAIGELAHFCGLEDSGVARAFFSESDQNLVLFLNEISVSELILNSSKAPFSLHVRSIFYGA